LLAFKCDVLLLQETEEDGTVAPQTTESGQFAFAPDTPTHEFDF